MRFTIRILASLVCLMGLGSLSALGSVLPADPDELPITKEFLAAHELKVLKKIPFGKNEKDPSAPIKRSLILGLGESILSERNIVPVDFADGLAVLGENSRPKFDYDKVFCVLEASRKLRSIEAEEILKIDNPEQALWHRFESAPDGFDAGEGNSKRDAAVTQMNLFLRSGKNSPKLNCRSRLFPTPSAFQLAPAPLSLKELKDVMDGWLEFIPKGSHAPSMIDEEESND